MQQLSAQDASFLYFETPHTHMHVGGLAIYDQSTARKGRVRFRDIVENVRKRLHRAKVFRRRLVEVPFQADHPYWIEDDDFDLEFHIRHIALPPPADWQKLMRQAARLHSYPLDRTRPLWEMTVISGLDNVVDLPKGAFAVLTKMHHAAIDGGTGAALTEVIHDLKKKPGEMELPSSPWVGESVPTAQELLLRSWGNTLMQPLQLAELATRAAPAMQRLANTLLDDNPLPTQNIPQTRFNHSVTPHRVMGGHHFPLADIRAMKSAVPNATVNDVVLTIVGGALRNYLEDVGELPDESLVAMAPINVRSADEQGAEGNRVAAMTAALGTDRKKPKRRLRAVVESTRQSKALTNAIGARLMTDYTKFVPAQLALQASRLYTALGMSERMQMPFNCVVTNVPGPQKPLYMVGARMIANYGMGPLYDGMGLIFPVFSYNGGVTISFNSCREMIPEPERMTQCLIESFAALRAATVK